MSKLWQADANAVEKEKGETKAMSRLTA